VLCPKFQTTIDLYYVKNLESTVQFVIDHYMH